MSPNVILAQSWHYAMTLEDTLRLFGSEPAKQNFLNLCKEYYSERVRQEAGETVGIPVPDSRRAEVHTEIMKIVQKLYLQRKDSMPSRRDVGLMIMEYFRQ